MKKILSALTAITLTFALAACGGNSTSGQSNINNIYSNPSTQTSSEKSETQSSSETSTSSENSETQSSSETSTSSENSETQSSSETSTSGENSETQSNSETTTSSESVREPDTPDESQTKSLVVYFSATGNTKAVAETLAGASGADIYEIVPEQPYTSDDLNYNDRSSRSTAEQNDKNARPAISGGVTNIEQYDVIYVGYPIWWGDMPRILYTFFDTYDLSGKTIAPFCTSGGSGLSGTPGTIADLESGATVLDGLHIGSSSANNSQSKVDEWLESIGTAA